jgi:hypothetical protein
MDTKIQQYIAKQKSPLKEVLIKLRGLFLKILPDPEEKSQWGAITYSNGKFYIAAMKTRVHSGFAIGGLSEEEIQNFEGGGKTMRHIKINSLEEINEKKLTRLIKLVDQKVTCKAC